jgi:hypothetical protein
MDQTGWKNTVAKEASSNWFEDKFKTVAAGSSS